MMRVRIRELSLAVAVGVLLPMLVACSGDGPKGTDEDQLRGASPSNGPEVIGTSASGCDLPVLVKVPEKWLVEAVTPEMVKLADDKSLTSPGDFAWVCSLLGSPDGVLAPILIFVAPPTVVGDLTAEQLLQKFVRGAEGNVKIEMRDVTTDAGPGVEGSYLKSRWSPPMRKRAFVVPTPNGAVAFTLDSVRQELVDEGIPDFESVRDSMSLRD